MAGTNFSIGVNDNEVIQRLDRVINKVESMGAVSEAVGKEMFQALGQLKDTASIEKAWDAVDAAVRENQRSISTLTSELKELKKLSQESTDNLDFKGARQYDSQARSVEKLLGLRKQLADEFDKVALSLDKEAQKVEANTNKQVTFRTELRETQEEYRRMVQAMKAGEQVDPKKFEEVKNKLSSLRRVAWETGAEMNKLSTPGTGIQGLVQGVGALTGAFSAAQGVMGLFNAKSEDTQKIMLKVQSLMSVMMGIQQIQNALLSTSALRIGVVNKVKEWWTGVTTKAAAAQAAENVAVTAGAGAFKTLGIAIKSIPGIGWLITGITALVGVVRALTKEAREAKRMQEELMQGVASEVANPIAKIRELSTEYRSLHDYAFKDDFVQRHKKDFEELGLSINSVADAEKALINNTDALVNAEMAKARASVARKMLEKSIEEQLKAEYEAEQNSIANVAINSSNPLSLLWGNIKRWRANSTVKSEGRKQENLQQTIQNSLKEAEGWMSQVNGAFVHPLDQLNSQLDGSINKLKEKLAGVQKLYNEATTDENRKKYKEELEKTQKEIDRLEGKRANINKSFGADPRDAQIRDLQKQIELVKNYREFYKEYVELTGDQEGALAKVKELFGVDDVRMITGDYVQILEGFRKQMEAIGGDKAKEAVETINDTIRAFKEGQAIDAAKAKQSLDKIFEEWNGHDFSTEEDNALFGGMGKVLAEMGRELDELAAKEKAEMQTLYDARAAMTKEEYNEKYSQLQLFYDREKVKIKENAKYRLSQLGDTISGDILNKFSKVFEQSSKVGVKAMKKELEAFKNIAGKDFGYFSEEDKNLLKGLLGMSENDDLWANLGSVAEETLKEALETSSLSNEQKQLIQTLFGLTKEGQDLQPILEEIRKKLGIGVAQGQATINGVSAESVQTYAGWAARLGQAIGGRTGAGISAIAGAAGNLAGSWSKLKGGDTASGVAMIVEGAVQMYDMFASQAKANKQVMKDWEAAVKEAAQATRIYAIEQLRYKPSNVWGIESPFKKLEDTGKMYDEAFRQLQDVSQQIAESGKLAKGVKKQVSGDNVMKGTAAGAMIGAGVGSIIPGIGTAIGTAVGAIAGTVIGLFARKKSKKYKNLTDVYGDIYDPETYELNQDILNDYAKMDDATKQLIDNWDEIKEKMKEAEEEMENTIADLTGDINGTLYDALIKAFDNDDLYGAMEDIEDYFSEMLKRMAVQSLIAGVWEDAAKKLQEGAKQSFFAGGDGSLIDDIMEFFDYTKEVFPVAVDAMSGIKDGLEKAGFKWDTNGVTSGSTGGYQTSMSHEDASEINGRMTDVQMQIRLIQGNIIQIVALQQETRGFARMQADYLYDIRRYTATLPVISEYAKKIATNTANL